MPLLRRLLGDLLRAHRQGQQRTLRDVADLASVSLAYLSEVERGVKEPSSELLAAICGALQLPLSQLLTEAGARSAAAEPVEPEPAWPAQTEPQRRSTTVRAAA